jgi:hypothetical protein
MSQILNDQSSNTIQFLGREAVVVTQNHWLQPKLASAAVSTHMHVLWLVAVETIEKEPVRP